MKRWVCILGVDNRCSSALCGSASVKYYDPQTSPPNSLLSTLNKQGRAHSGLNLAKFYNGFASLMSTTDAIVLSAAVQLWGVLQPSDIIPITLCASTSNKQGRAHVVVNLVKFFNDLAFVTLTTDAAVLSAVVQS